MILSNHASKRMQQRGITREQIDIILQFGKPLRRPGDALAYSISKRDRDKAIQYFKEKIQTIEKTKNKVVLVDSEGNEIITSYNRH